MVDETAKYCMKRLEHLKDKRKPWEHIWDKAAELCSVNSKIYTKDNRGRIIRNNFDSTARNSLTHFAAALKSILCPSNSVWHNIKPENPRMERSDDVKRYTQYMNDLLFKIRYSPASNFASEADMQLNQIGIYGHSPFLVEENVGRGIVYKSIPVNELYCETNRQGRIDTNYHKYELTLRQAIKEFGNKASKKMKEAYEKTPERSISLLHVVEPRENRDVRKKDYQGMRFASYHIDLENNETIYESGYRTQPFQVPHYLGIPGEIYGDAPALQAFCDILTINEMGKTTLRVGQLAANPTILLGQSIVDASRIGSAGAMVPGGLDAQGRAMAIPMQYGGNLNITLEMQNQVRQVIERAFLMPLFLSMTQDKVMTAEEARLRDAEKSMLLAPMGERISAEWLAPMIEREIDILSQYGYFDDVPDELMYDGALSVKFESPLVKMQGVQKVSSIYKVIESATALSQYDPTLLDKINFGKSIDYIADYENVPLDVLRTPEEMVALGEERAQREQAQALLQAAPIITQSIKDLEGVNNV